MGIGDQVEYTNLTRKTLSCSSVLILAVLREMKDIIYLLLDQGATVGAGETIKALDTGNIHLIATCQQRVETLPAGWFICDRKFDPTVENCRTAGAVELDDVFSDKVLPSLHERFY
jgi:hypothetical protein